MVEYHRRRVQSGCASCGGFQFPRGASSSVVNGELALPFVARADGLGFAKMGLLTTGSTRPPAPRTCRREASGQRAPQAAG